MKPPKNFYNAVDRRKLGLEDGLLPDVTTSDAGKVLKVSEAGAWQLADDGGSQTITVAITYDSEQEEYSADKTHAEIIAAIAAGVIVTATYNNRTFVYAGKNQPSAFDAVYFSYLQADSDDQFIGKIFEIDEDERITYSEHDLNNDNVLPAVTSADNGADLRVINGVWTKNILTKGSVISDIADAILLYCSKANFSGETPMIYFDFQYHSGYKCDVPRFLNVSNLKVFLLLNGKLVAFYKPFNDVFDYVQNPSDPNAPYIASNGNITCQLKLKPTYASQLTATDIKQYDFAYFRFMTNIVIDDPIST